ncbi:phytanoyl-CoA dioxygenase family protein [Halpernia frigidisoli]|uniref:Ectoine hydroxylase-related dioxygenase, phytanoyl-CoA dioxygenase (PhyH) family n=1 Tax=Halpernia frigidisoli TaxID=1125876 RepID=A0A1I3IIT1_9FLAO|nr:phytanoyl-CoA dioxygenase family protein [Halpernia frigidisoli]SFI47888.1 Ectoine hydroxylase-related dioxygenase, phytanoyl-CoA dioxygenase (PhyH) family [Halpernia frigidisoli]
MENSNRDFFEKFGYRIIENVYSNEEINSIVDMIEDLQTQNLQKETFRKTEDLFAIRQFHKELPEILPLIFNENFKKIIKEFAAEDYFIVKSIYFDKPEKSNWFVSYHQDLTISVDKKKEIDGFKNFTTKQNQFSVQPPIEFLENIVTFRIHLDDTSSENGALRIIPESFRKGIVKCEKIDVNVEKCCDLKKGGIMLMKPLTLHASSKTTNGKRRRVIHIEMANKNLPFGINWSEKIN